MDPQPSYVPANNDDSRKDVSSSSSVGERSFTEQAEGVTLKTDEKENKLVERVQGIALESHGNSSNGKTEWTTSTASIHLTTNVSNKGGMFEEEEEGELDYEEDEGEITAVQEDRNGIKNETDGDKEEGELEEDEQEEGEEGEILSDEDNKATTDTKAQGKQDVADNEADGPEEGEVIEEGDSSGALSLRKKVCRYFLYGGCTWGISCRFLHPGVNDKGAYQMLPVPGQYPSPFPKVPAVVPQVPSEAILPSHGMPPFPDHEEQTDEMIMPEVAATPKKETAWERGLKLAKERKKAAQKRKEEDADFEEKRMILGITAEEDEDENDKENLTRRREMMRNRLEKDFMFEEDDARYRRGGDIVSRWRDKRPTSPVQYRVGQNTDRDRRKRRVDRSPSSSPERDRRSRRKDGEKEKPKGKTKETTRDKERVKKTVKETEGKREEKVKKQKEKGSDSGKEKLASEEEKRDPKLGEEKNVADKQQANVPVKQQQQEQKIDEKKAEDEKRKIKISEKSADIEIKSTKEADSRVESNDAGSEERDKPKTKALGISSSRLPNDEWMDPWQRTTSPKRHSVSSASSRSRSSSSSSGSSRSSRSRSRSGSESRSSSRSASRSRSRSASQTPSRSPSRSRSGSRSKSRSRSGSLSSASDHSSSSSSKSPSKDVKTTTGEGGEERDAKQVSHESSESDSESESESNKSKSNSPTPVSKSPVKPKTSPDKGPRTPPVESSYNRNAKDKRNRFEYGRAERMGKWQEAQTRQGSPWNRRPVEDNHSRERGYHSRKRKSPDRRRRSRSPRARNEDRRRLDEGRTRERSSSADSMEHALARPSSPRATRERGGMRRGSSASSSSSESASSDTGSESEEERNPVRTRRAGPGADQVKRNVPLTSGNIRYTGHKDIKLTLNKSVPRPDRGEQAKAPIQHSPAQRTEASSSSEKQLTAKKRQRDPSPVVNTSNHAKEAVTSSVTAQPANKPDKRSVDSQAEAGASGKSNTANTSSRREELLRELKAVEDAIARKRARIE